jgi:hypothetical protein
VVTGSWVAGVGALPVGTVATTNGIAKAIDQRIQGDAGNADVMGRRYERSCPTGTPVTGRTRSPTTQHGSTAARCRYRFLRRQSVASWPDPKDLSG